MEEAQEKLPQILEDVKRGIEVIIEQNTAQQIVPNTGNDEKPRPRFGSAKHRLVYMADDFEAPLSEALSPPHQRKPIMGTAQGQVWIAPDFEATPEDFADYM